MKHLLMLALTLITTSAQAQNSLYTKIWQGNQLEVTSTSGQPISGANILIGYATNDPFEGNVFITDNQGTIDIPALWKTNLPVTVTANGYLAVTFADSLPLGRTIVLEKQETDTSYEVNGIVDGFGRLRRDGKVDVGFVMPAFTKRELFGFDISSVMSPETDSIDILGQQFSIPSNISLPRQQESYVFPFTLDKPQFRMFTRLPGTKKFIAGHAQFPLKRVIDKIRRGDSILDVINDFTFLGGGQQSVEMSTSPTTQNFSINEFQYSDKITVQGGFFDNSKVMFSVAVKREGDYYFPTDLKYIDANRSMELATMPGSNGRYVASMLANRPQNVVQPQWTVDRVSPFNVLQLFETPSEEPNLSQMSLVLQQYSPNLPAPQFLPFIGAPVIENGIITLTPPQHSSDIVALGTMIVFSEVESIPQQGFSSEKRTRLWEIFAPTWVDQVNIPDVQLPQASENKTHRWEVLYLGKAVGTSDSEGLDAVTHISRNSININ